MQKKSKEDYLRTIYELYELNNPKESGVSSANIAKELGITRPSVSEMLKKLSLENHVKFTPYSKVFLTRKGLKEAKIAVQNYKIIEKFLEKIVKQTPDKIQLEAHKLEHAFSQKSINNLETFMKKRFE